ncbi:MAG: hypothetical protein HQK49_19800 [Oligoflexia bacterium]|nr:hypothetical protein [Oligoflexia bacterium]
MKKKILYLNYFWITILFSGYILSLKDVHTEVLWREDVNDREEQSLIKNSFKIESTIKNLSYINNIIRLMPLQNSNNNNSYYYYNFPHFNSVYPTSFEIKDFIKNYGHSELYAELFAQNQFYLIGEQILERINNKIDDEIILGERLSTIDQINREMQGNENILKYNFNLAQKLFFLYHQNSDLEKVEDIYNILINFHNTAIAKSPFCFEFYRLQLSKNVEGDTLKTIIENCLAKGKNKKLIYEYITYIIAEKGIVTAQQEYEYYFSRYKNRHLKPPHYFFETL